MKANSLLFLVLVLLNTFGNQLLAQQSEAKQRYFEKLKVDAENGDPTAQNILSGFYLYGDGVPRDLVESVKWQRKAAEQGDSAAQYNLAIAYMSGKGVPEDLVEAYKWVSLALAQAKPVEYVKLDAVFSIGEEQFANLNGVTFKRGESRIVKTPLGNIMIKCQSIEKKFVWVEFNSEAESGKHPVFSTGGAGNHCSQMRSDLEQMMTPIQIAQAQQLVREFKPRKAPKEGSTVSPKNVVDSRPAGSGTGFLISENGFLVTNEHVVQDTSQIRLITSAGLISAKVVKVDAANDLALLKAEGRFAPLAIATSRGVKLGGTVATVGFPNIGLQGFAPKLAKGEIASLSGAGDDARYFQISVPVQPGNSGGALVDERGNVVGVVSAKLNAGAALRSSGALPENVNYAVKSSYLLSFLESVPDVANKLKEPSTKDKKFEDVVKEAEQAAVLVLVY